LRLPSVPFPEGPTNNPEGSHNLIMLALPTLKSQIPILKLKPQPGYLDAVVVGRCGEVERALGQVMRPFGPVHLDPRPVHEGKLVPEVWGSEFRI